MSFFITGIGEESVWRMDKELIGRKLPRSCKIEKWGRGSFSLTMEQDDGLSIEGDINQAHNINAVSLTYLEEY